MLNKSVLVIRNIAILFCLTLLASCQTQYQEGNFAGGVRALPVTNDTYRISANGNGYTSQSVIQDYVLLKASETTMQRGATHFAIINTRDTTRNEIGQTSSTANVIGGTVFINPGTTYNIVKPGQDTMIQVLTIPEGEQAPSGTFNAIEVFNAINPRVVRPKEKA